MHTVEFPSVMNSDSPHFQKRKYLQPAFSHNKEGLFMYSTLRLKEESQQRIASLQNRVKYLTR
jgi:hypothetical protein